MPTKTELTGARLVFLGAVNVTNVPFRLEEKKGQIVAPKDSYGTFSIAGGLIIIVTIDGEVWIAPSLIFLEKVGGDDGLNALLKEFCPGYMTPNDELGSACCAIHPLRILQRVNNPMFGCDGLYPPFV